MIEFLNATRHIWMSISLFIIIYLVIKNIYNLAKNLGDYLED